MMKQDELFKFYKNALSGALCEPLCDEYKGIWRASDGRKDELVKLAMRQQSIPYFAHYCREGKGLSKEYILSEFDDYINGTVIHDADGVAGYDYMLWVGINDDVVDVSCHVLHMMWCSTTLRVKETRCPNIYISNGSRVHLVCDGFNSVRVNLFDDSIIVIDDCDNDCDVTVYKYSEHCKVEHGMYCLSEKIYEHDKTLRL